MAVQNSWTPITMDLPLLKIWPMLWWGLGKTLFWPIVIHMCSTFSYLPIIFFRCCLTPWFYRGHYITTPNNAQTYRGNPSNFIPPKKNWWSHLIIPVIFPWDKNPKNPWLPRSAHRFCNAQGEPEVSDDACGIAGLTVGAVELSTF